MPVLRNPGNKFVPDARNLVTPGGSGAVGHGLAQRRFGGVQVGRQLHARHIERLRDFVEMISLTILGEHIANVEVGKPQDVF